MIYGLYLSATGVMTNSYRQDVISNNLANAETIGFKRDLALFQERRTESQERGGRPGVTSPGLERLGGGALVSPTQVDASQGELEPTGNPLDVGILGKGFFAVRNNKNKTSLTREGKFMVDNTGHMVMSNDRGQQVLDDKGKPIQLALSTTTEIGQDGTITQDGVPVARLGLFNVPDRLKLVKQGGGMLSYPDIGKMTASTAQLQSKFVERSNVDPATELANLMQSQRQLEANANMIRYQDETLGRLVNDVGKI
jgi:flagellar basal-body rod protein FlgG